MSKKFIFLFVAILALSAIFRLYRIADIPPGVNRDEASIGYTAYSILLTGKDEYGRFLPLSFESFGDWKLPFYIYLAVPFVAVFGLSELAVRLPSALFGIASVGLTFFLIRMIFRNNALALLTMFLIAISPWYLHFSRVESESNTAVFFIILGVILFFLSLRSKHWLIIPSAISFALTYFIYAGNHIFTTLLVIGLLIFYHKNVARSRSTLIAVILFICLSGFVFSQTLFGADATKISGIGIFGDPSVVHAKIELPRNEHDIPSSIFARFAHNRVIYAAEKFGQNYISSFSPEFLFIKGGNNGAHNIANFGNMYLIEAPFLFLGLIYMIVLNKSKDKKLILWWFFISAIAPSITKDAPHSNRMFAIFPILPLITAGGVYWLITDVLKTIWQKKIAIGIITCLFIVNFAVYIDRYYIHFPKNEAGNWGLGYKKLNKIISDSKFMDKKIVISNPEESPYIYLLFYQRYNPIQYQKTAVRYPPTEDKFVHVSRFGRYEFKSIDWGQNIKVPNALLIDKTSQVPEDVKNESHNTSQIILPNEKSMFTIVETK